MSPEKAASPAALGGSATAPADVAEMAGALLDAARGAGLRATAVTGLARLGGGASKEMWRFDLALDDGSMQPLVLRRQPPGRMRSSQGLPSVAAEAALVRLAARAGVPVPAIAFELPPGSSAGDGYAMMRIEGETVGGRVLKLPELAEARVGMARRCGEILARLHAARVDEALDLRSVGAREALDALEARHRDTGQDRPVFEFALRWLHDNLPDEGRRVLLHGDFRNGNLMWDPLESTCRHASLSIL